MSIAERDTLRQERAPDTDPIRECLHFESQVALSDLEAALLAAVRVEIACRRGESEGGL